MFAIKAEVSDPRAETFAFSAQKTMYGGKHIAKGDTIFRLRERERRRARSHRERRRHLGQSDRKETRDRPANAAREHHHQTHRAREAAPGAERAQTFSDWNDGRPETELNFKFYRQATNKIVGISDKAAAFLRGFFQPRPIST